MKISYDLCEITNFNSWSGATSTISTIIEAGKQEALMQLLEDIFPEGCTETQLNDVLWFERDWLFEMLEIKDSL